MSIIWGEVEPNFEGVMPCDGERWVRVHLNTGSVAEGVASGFNWLTGWPYCISSYQLEVLPAQNIKWTGPTADNVRHPAHYTAHPSGIECIQITEHMGFNLGNALKYIWRCDLKKDAIEDLEKAKFYIEREIAKRANL